MRSSSRLSFALAAGLAAIGSAASLAAGSLGNFRTALAEAAIGGPVRKMRRTRQLRASRLNRSRHWRYAETYKEARAMSPTPWTPVR